MKEAIAFFAGLMTMMIVWFCTDYFAHDSAYRRGYRQAIKDANKYMKQKKDVEVEDKE